MQALLTLSLASAAAAAGGTAPFVGGYALLNGPEGLAKLTALSGAAATLPVTRLFLGFFSPTMVYISGSDNITLSGLQLSSAPDGGYAALKAAISTLQASGVDVLLSMGGWDGCCLPYAYTRYSVAGYGTSTRAWVTGFQSVPANYWKIQEYCGGDVNAASAANEWCYTCEPPAANETINDFNFFPEPFFSPTWKAALAYVAAGASSAPVQPIWDTSFINGQQWTDPATGITITLPGSGLFNTLQRDPYADFVTLAKDLGAAGVDVDYEEMWHADMHKIGPAGGPWTMPQTVFKYAAVLKDVQLNIAAQKPSLLMSSPTGAASGWAGNWWGGNLKGLVTNAAALYPDLIAFVASTGGFNVMTYDLSDSETHYECPTPAVCTLHDQVDFYMNTYANASIPANVGYETGTPAYPDPVEDPTHQLPLTMTELGLITGKTQKSSPGGFFWEMFKVPTVAGEATPTQVAQAICNVVLPGNARCTGTIPPLPPARS